MRRKIPFLLLSAAMAVAQQRVITTIAGTDFTLPDGPIAALQVPLGNPSGLAFDAQGNLLFSDTTNLRIFQLSSAGIVTVAAGNGLFGQPGNGVSATHSPLSGPFSVACDKAGNVYIGDQQRVLRRDASGTLTIIAGSEINVGFSGDGGPANKALLASASGIATDSGGRVYIADSVNHRIRRIDLDGTIRTIAGTGPTNTITNGYGGDGGLATEALLNQPLDVAVDGGGNVYIADYQNYRLRRVRPNGIIETVAGNGTLLFTPGVPATQTGFPNVGFVALDPDGNPIFGGIDRVYRLQPNGQLQVLLSGTGVNLSKGAVSASGDVYINDVLAGRILRVLPSGSAVPVAGGGAFRFGGDGGPAISAFLNQPFDAAADSAGNVYISDARNFRIRRIRADGVIETVAGNGAFGQPALGVAAVSTPLQSPGYLAIDSGGSLILANASTEILRLAKDGTFSLIGGRGRSDDAAYMSENVPAMSVSLGAIGGIAVSKGTVYYTEPNFHRVRQIAPDGTLSSIAGRYRTAGFTGDGQAALQALVDTPTGIGVDSHGNVFFADYGNRRIRRITPAGVIDTVAGNGQNNVVKDGPALQSPLPGVFYDLAVDSIDNVYFSVPGTVAVLTPDGQLRRVAGGGTRRPGDGEPATEAVAAPNGIGVDAAGNVLIVETSTHRLRKVLVSPPAATVSTTNFSFEGFAGGPPAQAQNFTVSASILGVGFTASAQTTGGGQWLSVNVSQGETPRIVEVIADPGSLAEGTYGGTITVTTPNASPASRNIAVTLTVRPGLPAVLLVDRTNLSFTYPRQATTRSEALVVSNGGSGSISVSASATTVRGGSWLSVSPATTTVTARSAATLTVAANPTGLATGTYRGSILLNSSAGSVKVDATMTISARDTAIRLSQGGLSFLSVAGGGVVPPQNFAVMNLGIGAMPFAVSTSTLSGGNWLGAQASVNVSLAGQAPPLVNVNVDPSKLAPGNYYGLVRVNAPDAANTPQVVTVNLQVLPPGSTPGSVILPSELVFFYNSTSFIPESADFSAFNLNATPLSFRLGQPGFMLAGLPRDASIDPQHPVRVTIQPTQSVGAKLVVRDTLPIQFSDGRVVEIPLTFVGPSQAASVFAAGPRVVGCTPAMLIPSVVSLGQASHVPAGWPAGLVVEVKDDCGSQVDLGSVSVSFSNGDPPLSLLSIKNGRWQGTWTPRGQQPDVVVRVHAEVPEQKLQGERAVHADLQSIQSPPAITKDAIVSVASPVVGAPVSPGAVISLYGQRFTEGLTQAVENFPLPFELAGASVLIAGRQIPLFYANEQQINAFIPTDLEPNTSHQTLVLRGLTYSDPVSINVAEAAPSLFTYGAQRAIAYVARGDQQFLNGPDAPARSGDTLVFYCTALGQVSPTVPDGTASPFSPLAQVTNPVVVRIGGTALTPGFAGLTPGLVGLYQMNVALPEGLPKGANVEVTVEVSGLISPSALLAIQ